MLELVEWLRLQLDKDEVAADVALSGGPLVGEWRWARVSAQSTRFEACPVPPSRLLREVEAKRLLVDEYDLAFASVKAHPDDFASKGWLLSTIRALKLLALPYADRPGYRSEWKV